MTEAPREPGNTDLNRYAETRLSETTKWRQWAEAASDWNVVSNQQSFIDQATDQWQDCFDARLKENANTEHLLRYFSVTVMTFKVYVTAVMFRFTR